MPLILGKHPWPWASLELRCLVERGQGENLPNSGLNFDVPSLEATSIQWLERDLGVLKHRKRSLVQVRKKHISFTLQFLNACPMLLLLPGVQQSKSGATVDSCMHRYPSHRTVCPDSRLRQEGRAVTSQHFSSGTRSWTRPTLGFLIALLLPHTWSWKVSFHQYSRLYPHRVGDQQNGSCSSSPWRLSSRVGSRPQASASSGAGGSFSPWRASGSQVSFHPSEVRV